MRTRSTVAASVLCLAVAGALLTGCGSTAPGAAGQPTGAASGSPAQSTQPSSPTAPSGSPSLAAKVLTAGNCTLYTHSDAVALLGGVNLNNNAIDIGTDGGTKIDVCSYIDLKGMQDIQGVSDAVVRYDSPATAFAEAKKVQTQMLGSAASNNWPVQSLTAPVPGAGQLLGGYGSKSDNGITYTIAVVGTNVGPYLVAALGASSESADNAKKFALTLFQALSAKVG